MLVRDVRGGLPLRGIRVLVLCAEGRTSVAGCVLAALGADVVVVRPVGARRAAGRPDRCGRGIRLDLASPAGQDIAARLAAASHVLIEGHPADVMRSAGLDAATLMSRNRGLVRRPWDARSEASYDRGVLGMVAELQRRALADRGSWMETGLFDALTALGTGAPGAMAHPLTSLAGRGPHDEDVIEDWLGCGPTDIERFRGEGAFG